MRGAPPPVSSILILPSSFLLADAVDDIRVALSTINTIRFEVDLTLCPDYLEVCPQLMDLGTVKRKLGSRDDSEYLYNSEFIRDMRLIYANSIAYNNPDTVINELDRVRKTGRRPVHHIMSCCTSYYTINALIIIGGSSGVYGGHQRC